jgi:alpha-beta hydrolase superfamily lysophospholipase
VIAVIPIAVVILFCGGLWSASNAMLFPVWRGVAKDLAVCGAETAKYWGDGCGNLRTTHAFNFSEVTVRSMNGYELPGWLVGAEQNGMGAAHGAVLLLHGGGGDRREETRYVGFFLRRGLDVLTLDLGCHGEAPCPVPGMTYGHRESGDVLSAYLYLTDKYERVFAMGTSVGAAAILIALPEMPKLAAVVAENPMVSFDRLVMETPAASSVPRWFKRLLINLTMLRGKFDGRLSAENSLRLAKTAPILFIHSRRDSVVPYQQSQELADLYAGPKVVWLPDNGDHAAIWDVDHADYERRLGAFLDGVR